MNLSCLHGGTGPLRPVAFPPATSLTANRRSSATCGPAYNARLPIWPLPVVVALYIGRPMSERATFRVKSGLAEMLKGGVIMDVVDAEQARIAEASGATAVMALERVPSDIRAQGGV